MEREESAQRVLTELMSVYPAKDVANELGNSVLMRHDAMATDSAFQSAVALNLWLGCQYQA